VEAAGRPLTMYLGPETVLLVLDVRFHHNLSDGDVTNVGRPHRTSGPQQAR
jgi:hypothetical protein